MSISLPILIQCLRSSIKAYHANSIHAVLVKSGILASTQASNHLLTTYTRLLQFTFARQVFDEMPRPNIVSWSSLLTGYTQQGKPTSALTLYTKLLQAIPSPNAFTLSAVITACSLLGIHSITTQVHAHVFTLGLQTNVVAASSLIAAYGKCKDTDQSRKIFNHTPFKNVVTWASLMTAYTRNSNGQEALQIFRQLNNLAPTIISNEFTLASAIHTCATTGSTTLGKSCHAAAIRHLHDTNDVIAASIVNMYAKQGSFEMAHNAFRRIAVPSTVSHTAVIAAAAKCGEGERAVELFEAMVQGGIEPNEVTMLAVLHGCSHGGLVEEGVSRAMAMCEKHGVVGGERHYACVVDMLGRAGWVEEAYAVAKWVNRSGSGSMDSVWGALLGSCRVHGRVDIAFEAARKVARSDRRVGAAAASLCNVYAAVGDWAASNRLRLEMVTCNVYKEAASSWAM